MATFEYLDIFGWSTETNSSPTSSLKVTIDTADFRKDSHGGQLAENVGLDADKNPSATQLVYGILMMLLKYQGATVNTDPTQKVYVTDAGKSIATGTRDGQVKRSFTVSFFIDAGLAGTPGIDQIDTQ
mgnify:FL=1